ncbi:hypothetical protein Acr_00g0012420 [Actinidia rufa]|uniref:Uncharacterized protein n=1 Tax=Actinidia rufa TaxID=165716 RepID=A0A7J0DB54_9ERIC|nr:hypothetical protein Acr_00g0012420 [Actinidia rufa]
MVNKPSFGRRFKSRSTPRPPVTLPPSRQVPTTAPLFRDGKENGILAESLGMNPCFNAINAKILVTKPPTVATELSLSTHKVRTMKGMILKEQLYEPDLKNLPEFDEDCEGGDVTLGVVRCALTQAKEGNDWRRNVIFHTYIKCGEKDCKVIIDSGSCINAVSLSTVSHLGFKASSPS